MIPLTKPSIGIGEINSVTKTLQSGWITQGPKVQEFEAKFSNYTGAKYAAAVSSCTTGLQLSLISLGVEPGDLVITVSHSYIATANSIRHAQAEPIFVDVSKENYNLDLVSLKDFINNECKVRDGHLYYKKYKNLIQNSPTLKNLKKVNGKISAIIVPHQIGIPANVKEVKKLLGDYKISIIEDAACAIGSIYDQKKYIGNPIGDAVCFSFHPRKVITTGDGGMVTSNNKKLIENIKSLRNHGMNIDPYSRKNSKKYFFDVHVDNGFNYRLTDIQAAMGVEQLARIDEIVDERRQLGDIYKTELSTIRGLSTFENEEGNLTNWQSFPINILTRQNSKQLVRYLFDRGVFSKRGVMNSHEEPPYIKQSWNLKNSEYLLNKTVLLPMYNGLTKKDIKFVCEKVSKFFK
jgi:dTDP-4-amino-4,6-dideoxygalactose transaminase